MIFLPFSLRHIPEWHALEIKTNGKNTAQSFSRFKKFIDSVPETVFPDDFSWLIPDKYFKSYMSSFSEVTTMTQTVSSIEGTEKIILPEINYELKHLDSLNLQPYPFQKIGISYLLSVEKGILGDEMGLGS